MNKIILKITTVLLFFSLMLVPVKSSDGQVIDLINIAIDLSKKVSSIYTGAKTALEVEGLLEELACAKYTYDNYRAKISFKSCLVQSEFTLLDVEFSSLYNDIAKIATDIINSDDQGTSGQTKLSDILEKLRAILEKMKKFNNKVEQQIVDEQKFKGTVSFCASSLGRSF